MLIKRLKNLDSENWREPRRLKVATSPRSPCRTLVAVRWSTGCGNLRAVQRFSDDLFTPMFAYHSPRENGVLAAGIRVRLWLREPIRPTSTSTCRNEAAVAPCSAFATTWWIPRFESGAGDEEGCGWYDRILY